MIGMLDRRGVVTPQKENSRQENARQGHGRLRVRKACETCKRRKVKCDGNQPCSNCVRHDQECKYVNSTAVRRRYRRDNDELVSQYCSAVNGEAGMTRAGSTRKNVYSRELIKTSNSIGYCSKKSPWQSFSLDKYRFHRRYQNLLPFYLGASLMSEIPEAAIQRHRLKQPRIQDYGWNMSGGHYLKHDSNWKGDSGSRLEREEFFDFSDAVQLSVVSKLLEFYFQEINPALSIVHEAVFWKQFNDKFLPCTKVRDSSAKLFQSILYLILAITIRFREGFMKNTAGANEKLFSWEELRFFDKRHREESLFEYAYGIVSELTFEWESFELIQSWLLITFYFRTCYRQTACWNALGQAINMCNGMSLYLNRFPRAHSEYDESRAWHCFWACFIMDKLISFQMGRYYQLPMPVGHMSTPGNLYDDSKFELNKDKDADVEEDDSIWSDTSATDDGAVDENAYSNVEDDWFHCETAQLFELAVIVQSCQRRDGEELDLEESIVLRKKLDNWFEKNVKSTRIDKKWKYLYQIQPVLSYLDVRLTFETRRIFLLINQPLDTGEMIFPNDTLGLVNHCQLSVRILSLINQRELYFVPWWLNLSQLFTLSLISISLIHSGLQTAKCRNILQQCMDIWNSLAVSNPQNPPGMMPECLWCIKMLNHMCCLRLQTSAAQLENLVGINPGDPSPNDSKFSQFGKIGENGKTMHADEGFVHVGNDNKVKLPSPRSQPVAVKNGPNGRVLVSAPPLNPSENDFKIAMQSQTHIQEETNMDQPVLSYNSGPINTPDFSQDPLNTRLHNIPPLSLPDGDSTDNREGNDATAEGLFSYLQWFDQNLM